MRFESQTKCQWILHSYRFDRCVCHVSLVKLLLRKDCSLAACFLGTSINNHHIKLYVLWMRQIDRFSDECQMELQFECRDKIKAKNVVKKYQKKLEQSVRYLFSLVLRKRHFTSFLSKQMMHGVHFFILNFFFSIRMIARIWSAIRQIQKELK